MRTRVQGWLLNGASLSGCFARFVLSFLRLTAGPAAYARDGVQFTAPCLMQMHVYYRISSGRRVREGVVHTSPTKGVGVGFCWFTGEGFYILSPQNIPPRGSSRRSRFHITGNPDSPLFSFSLQVYRFFSLLHDILSISGEMNRRLFNIFIFV